MNMRNTQFKLNYIKISNRNKNVNVNDNVNVMMFYFKKYDETT